MNHSWKKWIFGIVLIILLVGCTSQDRYKYSGESEHWKGKVGMSTKNEGTYELVLTYKGDVEDLSSVRELTSSFEMGGLAGKNSRGFGESPSRKSFKSNMNNIQSEVDDENVINLKVQWEDHEESFQLEKE